MTAREIMEARNQSRRLVRQSNKIGSHCGCIRIGSETPEHARLKFEICLILHENGFEYLTEAIFENGSRADILVTDLNISIECLVTEKDGPSEKDLKYPVEIYRVRTVDEARRLIEGWT